MTSKVLMEETPAGAFRGLLPQLRLGISCPWQGSVSRVYFHSYLSRLERISEDSYIPTAQDVLRSRMPTTGINEYCFSVQKTKLRLAPSRGLALGVGSSCGRNKEAGALRGGWMDR